MCMQQAARKSKLNNDGHNMETCSGFRKRSPLVDWQPGSRQPGYEKAVMDRAKEIALEAKGRGAWVPDVERVALNIKMFDAYVDKLFSGKGSVPADRSGWI